MLDCGGTELNWAQVFGLGLRPPNWQGWSIMLVFPVVVAVIAVLAAH